MITRINIAIGNNSAYLAVDGNEKKYRKSILKGEKVNAPDSTCFSIKNKTKQYNDCIGDYTYFLVNEKVKNIIESTVKKQQIQFVPFKFLEDKTYWLLNCIGLKDCMDYNNSIYTTFDDESTDEITALKVNTAQIAEYDLFRLKEHRYSIFITKKLQEKLEEAGITGVEYLDTMDLTFG